MRRETRVAGDANSETAWNKDDGSNAGKWKTMSIDGLEYGQLSPEYFAQRLASYLKLDVHVRPPPLSQLVDDMSSDSLEECDALGRTQQDYFLDLFWMGTHTIFPVIDEDSFRELYASLWRTDDAGTDNPDHREPHALVDIVLALNMQFASSFLPTGASAPEIEESAFAGGCFYRRCQKMLDRNAERTSVTDVQAHFFLHAVSCFCWLHQHGAGQAEAYRAHPVYA
jgi:hypothetical protein